MDIVENMTDNYIQFNKDLFFGYNKPAELIFLNIRYNIEDVLQ